MDDLFLGTFGDRRLDVAGQDLLSGMLRHETTCLRRAAQGQRREIVRFGRFLRNERVSVEALIEGWSEQTQVAVADRHVLAIQDTTSISFKTTPENRRELGLSGLGSTYGVVLHPMLALDARTGSSLGLVAGQIWTRAGTVSASHRKRALSDKESQRWITTAQQAKPVLRRARMVTFLADRESDFYANWTLTPSQDRHLIARVMQDRSLGDGSRLFDATAIVEVAATRVVDLPARAARATTGKIKARPARPARKATVSLRYCSVELRRPQHVASELPEIVPLRLVEAIERDPPATAEPLHWRLLTTHAVDDAAAAWQIVDWYRMRWTIEQLFRTLKKQGLKVEDSQLETADRLLKLVAIATKAAATIMQLVQARDGGGREPASDAFSQSDLKTLDALSVHYHGTTKLQQNPHPRRSLAWAAWIIARLGGWDGYPNSAKPGPITFKYGLDSFRKIAFGATLQHV
jgi:hypothetical protein